MRCDSGERFPVARSKHALSSCEVVGVPYHWLPTRRVVAVRFGVAASLFHDLILPSLGRSGHYFSPDVSVHLSASPAVASGAGPCALLLAHCTS